MPARSVEISVEKKHRSDGTSISKDTVTALFEEAEVRQLVEYHAAANALTSSTLVQKGLPNLKQLGYNVHEGWRFDVTPFVWSDVHAALHLARPLILESEPASFHRTRGLLGRRFAHADVQQFLRRLRNHYLNGIYQPYFQFRSGEIPLFAESTFLTWLNGTQYHHDPDKRKQIKSLEDDLGPNNVHNLIALHLTAKIEAIGELDFVLVKVVLRKLGESVSR